MVVYVFVICWLNNDVVFKKILEVEEEEEDLKVFSC